MSTNEVLPAPITTVESIPLRSASLPPGGWRTQIIIRRVAWVGITAHAAFVPIFFGLRYPFLAAFNLLSVGLWVWAARANRRHKTSLAMWILVIEVISHAMLSTLLLGWSSGFQYYLIPLIPFVMFNDRLRTRTAMLISALVLLLFALLYGLSPSSSLNSRIGAGVLAYANMVIPFVALGLMSYFFRLASTDAEQALAQMAETDPLTGLFNRRSMTDRLREEANRFMRSGSAFGVILADIDHFKHINDSYGHDVGDRVLAAVGNFFRQELRGQDIVARWGGEEFLVLLPNTDLAAATDVANRLHVAAHSRLSRLPGVNRKVTLTFGVSTYDGQTTLDSCLKAADESLYDGKASGRDKVVTSPPGRNRDNDVGR